MMARYRLVSVKHSQRIHKRDEHGNLLYKDDDKKVPIYELKQYKVGDIVELTAAEVKRMRKDIKPIGGTVAEPADLNSFEPDDDGEIEDGSGSGVDASVLDQNVADVVSYLDTIADDEDALTALREAEVQGKNRVTVLNAIDELLGN